MFCWYNTAWLQHILKGCIMARRTTRRTKTVPLAADEAFINRAKALAALLDMDFGELLRSALDIAYGEQIAKLPLPADIAAHMQQMQHEHSA
jgi:hypothetical protein